MGIIRFLLAVLVVIIHTTIFNCSSIVPSYLAVYIISVFLMTLVFCKKYSLSPKPIYLFITNRLFQLYPFYFFVIFLVLVFSLLIGVYSGSWEKLQYYINYYNEEHLLLSLFLIFISNITLIGQNVISFFKIDKFLGDLSYPIYISHCFILLIVMSNSFPKNFGI